MRTSIINTDLVTYERMRALALEVERQEDSHVAVVDMIEAYDFFMLYVLWSNETIPARAIEGDFEHLLHNLYHFITGQRDFFIRRYRDVPVFINGIEAGAKPGNIDRQVSLFIKRLNDLGKYGRMAEADDLYHHFEWIHPFEDGNGRIGFLLYNWFKMRFLDSSLPLLVPPPYPFNYSPSPI